MSDPRRKPSAPEDPVEARHLSDEVSPRTSTEMSSTDTSSTDTSSTDTSPKAQGARSRAGAAWLGISIAVFTSVILIIFLLQNTQNVEVSFLWLSGSLPLAIALLIAGVGVGILIVVIGTVRITQLRRRASRSSRERDRASRSSREPH
jgi:lipopolysaccharide assembly protein A